MLKEKLENREQELQLQIIQVRESADNYCAELEKNREDFENYKLEKSREVDEFKSYKDDSAKKSGQIDAFDAQIQSLKSVQEALEREKDDLLI